MKYPILAAVLLAALFSLSSVSRAENPTGYVWDYEKSPLANGKVIKVDLDGDGKKESVSLVPLWKAKDGNSSAYRLKVNDVVLDDYWTESDIAGNVTVEGLLFGDLNTRDRFKEILVGGPSEDNTAFKIYAWRDGKIRRVLRQPLFIERFNGDGTITEIRYSGWAVTRLPYRLNRQGELKLVQKASYPLAVYGSSEKRKSTLVRKNVFFRLQPNSKSLAFEVKQGSTIVFDRMNNKGWAGATINGRVGWILDEQVNADSETFDLTKAG